jgi:hypothetical protein
VLSPTAREAPRRGRFGDRVHERAGLGSGSKFTPSADGRFEKAPAGESGSSLVMANMRAPLPTTAAISVVHVWMALSACCPPYNHSRAQPRPLIRHAPDEIRFPPRPATNHGTAESMK